MVFETLSEGPGGGGGGAVNGHTEAAASAVPEPVGGPPTAVFTAP